MNEVALVCGKRSQVSRRRFLSIERGEIGRKGESTCPGVHVEKCPPAQRDQVGRGAPHLKGLTTRAGLWVAGQEHLASEDEQPQGEASSCVLRDSRSIPAPERAGQSVR